MKTIGFEHYAYLEQQLRFFGVKALDDYETALPTAEVSQEVIAKINATMPNFKKLFRQREFNLSKLKYTLTTAEQTIGFLKKLMQVLEVPFEVYRFDGVSWLRLKPQNQILDNYIKKMSENRQIQDFQLASTPTASAPTASAPTAPAPRSEITVQDTVYLNGMADASEKTTRIYFKSVLHLPRPKYHFIRGFRVGSNNTELRIGGVTVTTDLQQFNDAQFQLPMSLLSLHEIVIARKWDRGEDRNTWHWVEVRYSHPYDGLFYVTNNLTITGKICGREYTVRQGLFGLRYLDPDPEPVLPDPFELDRTKLNYFDSICQNPLTGRPFKLVRYEPTLYPNGSGKLHPLGPRATLKQINDAEVGVVESIEMPLGFNMLIEHGRKLFYMPIFRNGDLWSGLVLGGPSSFLERTKVGVSYQMDAMPPGSEEGYQRAVSSHDRHEHWESEIRYQPPHEINLARTRYHEIYVIISIPAEMDHNEFLNKVTVYEEFILVDEEVKNALAKMNYCTTAPLGETPWELTTN